jgi:dCMP deaminase
MRGHAISQWRAEGQLRRQLGVSGSIGDGSRYGARASLERGGRASANIARAIEINVDSQRAAPGAKIETALRAASLSPNRVRKGGAVLVARDGAEIAACNMFPAGVRDLEERHAGDGRFVWMVHAERRAIFEAARRERGHGRRLPATFFPCIDCARAIVDAAVARLAPEPDFGDPISGGSFEIANHPERRGVEVRIVEAGARS